MRSRGGYISTIINIYIYTTIYILDTIYTIYNI